jgi:hypothetical protein
MWYLCLGPKHLSVKNETIVFIAIQPARIQPFSHSAIQPFSHSAIQLFSYSAIQLFSYSAIQQHFVFARLSAHISCTLTKIDDISSHQARLTDDFLVACYKDCKL